MNPVSLSTARQALPYDPLPNYFTIKKFYIEICLIAGLMFIGIE